MLIKDNVHRNAHHSTFPTPQNAQTEIVFIKECVSIQSPRHTWPPAEKV